MEPPIPLAPDPFWKGLPGIVWSKPAAEDAVWIRAALLQPRFENLLKIAREFGLAGLRQEWQVLSDSAATEPDFMQAASVVIHMLTNIEIGFQQRDVTSRN